MKYLKTLLEKWFLLNLRIIRKMNNLKTRDVDPEFVRNLELVSSKIYPLHGATFDRGNHSDPRVKDIPLLHNNKITLYEHIATIRHRSTDKFFVAFRQTMDCLYLEQRDLGKYPEWLMKSEAKTTELSIHIYQVRERNGIPIFPKDIPNASTHEDWLEEIKNGAVFDALSYFLLRQPDIKIEMFKSR
jgi:hypothetical protein